MLGIIYFIGFHALCLNCMECRYLDRDVLDWSDLIKNITHGYTASVPVRGNGIVDWYNLIKSARIYKRWMVWDPAGQGKWMP